MKRFYIQDERSDNEHSSTDTTLVASQIERKASVSLNMNQRLQLGKEKTLLVRVTSLFVLLIFCRRP